jgi:hypothetical protein
MDRSISTRSDDGVEALLASFLGQRFTMALVLRLSMHHLLRIRGDPIGQAQPLLEPLARHRIGNHEDSHPISDPTLAAFALTLASGKSLAT